eukprot:3706593-Prymnesium_polylepis.2
MCSECDSECAVRMEGEAGAASALLRRLRGGALRRLPTRCPRVPCRCVTAGAPDGVCNGRETAIKTTTVPAHTVCRPCTSGGFPPSH